jgi:sulfoxide reductase heme-binding subunit YedZ
VALAIVAGLLTALAEAAWYGLATGVPAWPVLAANLDFDDVRPAWWVLAAGLALATVNLARRRPVRRPRPAPGLAAEAGGA